MKKISYTCILFFCLTAAAFAQTKEMTRFFLEGIDFYKAGKYSEASESFQKIADSGVKSGKLYYNLGNAYLKSGKLGPAILWYEKALRLIPHDPDLKFNHAYAVSKVKDDKGEKSVNIFRILFFWKFLLDAALIRWLALGFNALFCILVTARLLMRKKIMKTPVILSLILSAVFTLTALYHFYESAYIRRAVILPPEAVIRSGLSGKATELFRLHEGTTVRIEQEKEEYFRIYFSEGKIGWIPKKDTGVI